MQNDSAAKGLVAIVIILIIAIAAYNFMTMPDRRNMTEKVGDAIHDLPQGVDKASRQLEDRTPGQKVGDSIKDFGDKVKDNTSGR